MRAYNVDEIDGLSTLLNKRCFTMLPTQSKSIQQCSLVIRDKKLGQEGEREVDRKNCVTQGQVAESKN